MFRKQWFTSSVWLAGGVAMVSMSSLALGDVPSRNLKEVTLQKEVFKPAPGKKPIAHKAFPILDPKTGKPMKPEELIELPNGRKMPAGKYYEQLNRHEAALNQFGRSLKEKEDELGMVAEIPRDTLRLDDERGAVLREHDPSFKEKMLTAEEIQTEHAAAQKETRRSRFPRDINAAGVCNQSLQYSRPYSRTLGGSQFGAEISATITGKALCNSLEATAEGAAYGTIFSRYQLARGYARGYAPSGAPATLQIRLNTLGREILRRDYSSPTLAISDGFNLPFDENGEFHTSIGPIPVSVSYGVAGSVGMTWSFGVGGARVSGQAVPRLQSRAYLEGGIDAVVASAGVGGQMTLLNDTMTAYALAEVAPKDNKSQFHIKATLNNSLTALAGRLYGWVKVYVPRWGIPPWTEKKYEKDFFNWSGITASGQLFSAEQWTPVSTGLVVVQ